MSAFHPLQASRLRRAAPLVSPRCSTACKGRGVGPLRKQRINLFRAGLVSPRMKAQQSRVIRQQSRLLAQRATLVEPLPNSASCAWPDAAEERRAPSQWLGSIDYAERIYPHGS